MQTDIKDLLKRVEKLEKAVFKTGKTFEAASKSARPKNSRIDFSRNERNFVKRHAAGMNGEKKFALLVAYIAKGDQNTDVKAKNIESHWNKMKSSTLLGCPYNSKYATIAKDNGWVDSRQRGTYHVTDTWEEVFE